MPNVTIEVPFNESTVRIYEAYIKVAKEIAGRSKTRRDIEDEKPGESA